MNPSDTTMINPAATISENSDIDVIGLARIVFDRIGVRRALWAGILLGLGLAQAHAAALGDAGAIPHLSSAGRDDYRQFLASPGHRAFAIAPGGSWGFRADAGSADEAADAALASCQERTRQRCVLYAVDNAVVFDARGWAKLWSPYRTAAEAASAPSGMARGERFPDLAFRDPSGKRLTLSALRGRVVVLHFWGSWCGPCRKEMPDLQALAASFKARKDVAFVLLQVREPFDKSRNWVQAQGIRLPLHDSGSTGETDDQFTLAGGGRLKDRAVAAHFPTTYVLDSHGLVLFSHVGPVPAWGEYAPFLRDAAARSGK